MPLVFDLVDAQPGHVLPGAVPADQATVTAAAGAGTIIENYFGVASGEFKGDVALGAFVQGTAALTDRLAVNVGGALLGMDLGQEATWGFTFGARYNLVEGDTFRLAPFLASARWAWEGIEGAAAGLALEGGGDRVRWDLSLPLVGVMSDRAKDCPGCYEVQPYMPIFGEAGVSVALGEHDLLRVGTTSAAPNVAWRHLRERWFLGATLVVVPAYRFSEIASVSAGVRW